MRTAALVLLLSAVAVGAALVPGARVSTANPIGGMAAIATGSTHTCALTDEGGVKCWGQGSLGQLGDGTTERRLTPVDVLSAPGGPPLEGVAAVGAGSGFACVLMTSGGVKCWGWNTYGRLGDGTQAHRVTPVDVCAEYDATRFLCIETLSNVTALSVGARHACALVSGGRLKCWGQNVYAELGDGTRGDELYDIDNFRTTPVEVCQDYDDVAEACAEPLSGAIAVSAGTFHTCALMPATRLKCWGLNLTGQLGDGTGLDSLLDPIVRTTPVDVCEAYDDIEERCTEVFSGAAAVAAGYFHTCALTTSGGVKCWGSGIYGSLGNGGDLCTAPLLKGCTTPVDVCADDECIAPLSGVSAVSVGLDHSCALMAAGSVKCWGRNRGGSAQLGDGLACGYTCETPVDVCGGGEPGPCKALLANVTAVTAENSRHSCALLEGGRAKCWGKNASGQLGDGTRINWGCNCRSTPVWVVEIDVKLPPAPGDADCDGTVTATDALLVLQFDAGLMPTVPCLQVADLNLDGRVNSIDAAIILQFQQCWSCDWADGQTHPTFSSDLLGITQ